MRLDLSKDDAKAVAADNDLAGTRVHNAKRTERLGELSLVARARLLRQRPRHLGERDAKRVRGAADRQAGRRRSL
jgi:hypothetical protein